MQFLNHKSKKKKGNEKEQVFIKSGYHKGITIEGNRSIL